MSDRIAIMNQGRIVQCGAPRAIYEHPCNAFAASFLGTANLFPAAAESGERRGPVIVRLASGGTMKAVAGTNPAAAGVSLVACVRPETIRIGPAGSLTAGDEENSLQGRVADATYTAGTFRYQVDVGLETVVTVKLPAVRQTPMLERNQAVTLVWPASATLLIPMD